MQFDFFSPLDIQVLKDDFEKVKSSSENVRRGIFARHDQLIKKCDQLEKEIKELKEAIYGKKEEQITFKFEHVA